eukprot:1835997-Rhodomonas_salina.1
MPLPGPAFLESGPQAIPAISLHSFYALCSTDLAYAATSDAGKFVPSGPKLGRKNTMMVAAALYATTWLGCVWY